MAAWRLAETINTICPTYAIGGDADQPSYEESIQLEHRLCNHTLLLIHHVRAVLEPGIATPSGCVHQPDVVRRPERLCAEPTKRTKVADVFLGATLPRNMWEMRDFVIHAGFDFFYLPTLPLMCLRQESNFVRCASYVRNQHLSLRRHLISVAHADWTNGGNRTSRHYPINKIITPPVKISVSENVHPHG